MKVMRLIQMCIAQRHMNQGDLLGFSSLLKDITIFYYALFTDVDKLSLLASNQLPRKLQVANDNGRYNSLFPLKL